MLEDIAEYSNERIDVTELSPDNYVSVENLLQNKMGKVGSECVPTSGKWIKYSENDLLIGNIRPYLKKIWQADAVGGTNGDVLVIHLHNNLCNPRYLYFILSSDKFFAYDDSHAKGAKMPRGNKEAVMQYQFYLPTLKEQTLIVSILDRFDALCNDLSAGLPAEIEARQKQYEHYRDRLLDFHEKS